jgi:RNA processing factor Prp31
MTKRSIDDEQFMFTEHCTTQVDFSDIAKDFAPEHYETSLYKMVQTIERVGSEQQREYLHKTLSELLHIICPNAADEMNELTTLDTTKPIDKNIKNRILELVQANHDDDDIDHHIDKYVDRVWPTVGPKFINQSWPSEHSEEYKRLQQWNSE